MEQSILRSGGPSIAPTHQCRYSVIVPIKMKLFIEQYVVRGNSNMRANAGYRYSAVLPTSTYRHCRQFTTDR